MEQLAAPSPQSTLLFETPAQIFERVFREWKPRTAAPEVHVEFRKFANANSSIRMHEGRLDVKMADMLEGAPAPVLESLAHILISKMLRRETPAVYSHRYRLYLNRKDVRRQMHLIRQIRGRKLFSGPRGEHRDLREVFDRVNQRYFGGMMGAPELGWSRRPSRSLLGHFDPSHNAIVISRIFDRPEAPELALEYVMYHEMLHLRHPVEHHGARRCVHGKAFREDEKQFERLKEAKELLKKL